MGYARDTLAAWLRGRSLRDCLMVAGGAVALVAVLWLAPAYACTPRSQLTVAPSEAEPGATVRVDGTWLSQGAAVTVYWGSVDGPVLAEATANAQGAFDVAVTIPAGEPGAYAIIAVQNADPELWPVAGAFHLLPATAPPSWPAGAACPPERTAGSGFTDIAGNTHQETIECTASYGIAQGTSATTFSPAQGVRRDQMAAFLTRLLTAAGVDLPDASSSMFTDIAGNPHAQAIAQLAELGVVQGVSPTSYAPDSPVRRDQMASFLVRALELVTGQMSAGATPFTDIAGTTHAAAIGAAYQAGLTRGTSDTTYGPAAVVRRDQMASFLTRALDHVLAAG